MRRVCESMSASLQSLKHHLTLLAVFVVASAAAQQQDGSPHVGHNATGLAPAPAASTLAAAPLSTESVVLFSFMALLGATGVQATGFGMAIIYLTTYEIIAACGGFDHEDNPITLKFAVFVQAMALFSTLPFSIRAGAKWKHMRKDLLVPLVPITFVGTPLGQLAQAELDENVVRVALGATLLLACVLMLYKARDLVRKAAAGCFGCGHHGDTESAADEAGLPPGTQAGAHAGLAGNEILNDIAATEDELVRTNSYRTASLNFEGRCSCHLVRSGETWPKRPCHCSCYMVRAYLPRVKVFSKTPRIVIFCSNHCAMPAGHAQACTGGVDTCHRRRHRRRRQLRLPTRATSQVTARPSRG